MKEQIINYIKQNKTTNFQDIFSTLNATTEIFTKPDLKNILNELEDDGTIISAFNQVYDKQSLADKEGFIQWNMNGFCWLDDTDKSNSHGLTFDIPDEAVSVFNKKQTVMGSYSKGKIIEQNDKKYFYSLEQTGPQKDLTLIYYVDDNGKTWQLNNGQKMQVSIENANTVPKSINKAQYIKDEDKLVHTSEFGLLSDKGIESKIAFELGQLQTAPPNDSPEETPSELKDFTKKKFFTVDGLYTKDIDDAICFEKTKTGYNLFVAIANVSQYVLPGTAQDEHAKKAATSFYLAHQTVHMLARELAEKQCSLNPGEIKSTMVCKMSFDMEGNVTKYKFLTANIFSHARLTYEDVDLMLENKKPVNSIFIEDKKHYRVIKNTLLSLNHFMHLKPISGNRGSRVYTKSDYVLNEDGKVSQLVDSALPTSSEKIVEFCMLHANMSAAQHLFKHYPEIGLFRNQSIPLDIEKPKAAFYDSNNDGHWGLDAQFYTHFTSPIRRYCDLIVHRLIKATLAGKERTYTQEQLSEIADTINFQQNKSKQIETKVRNLLTQQYVEELFTSKKLGKTLTILDVTENGLVTRNKQKIEYFIPEFKMPRFMQDKIATLVTPEQKQEFIKEINTDYKVLGFVDYFSWLDERKNTSFYIQSKQQIIDRQKEKDAAREATKNTAVVEATSVEVTPVISNTPKI